MERIGERLTELLRQQGMSQKQLAELIGVTEATVSRYITGDRTPKSGILANMATALHTTSDYLLGKENDNGIEVDFTTIQRLIARNASNLSIQEKKILINTLLDNQ